MGYTIGGDIMGWKIKNTTEIKKVESSLADIINITNVLAVSNTYTFDLQGKAVKNFKFETTDANAKTIAFVNVPSNALVQVTVKMKYTTACSITRPASVVWQNGVVPAFTVGKTYFTQYITDDGGTTWYASSVGAW